LSPDGLDEGMDCEAQELCEPFREQAKVVAGGGEGSIVEPTVQNYNAISIT
jgi:hypothetical protein